MKDALLNSTLIAIYVISAICTGGWMLLWSIGLMRLSQAPAEWLVPNLYDLPLWQFLLIPELAGLLGLIIAAASAYLAVKRLVVPMGLRLIDRAS